VYHHTILRRENSLVGYMVLRHHLRVGGNTHFYTQIQNISHEVSCLQSFYLKWWKPGFDPRSVRLGLGVDKVALGHVCLPCVFMACLGKTLLLFSRHICIVAKSAYISFVTPVRLSVCAHISTCLLLDGFP
jgi:hypothetical protein